MDIWDIGDCSSGDRKHIAEENEADLALAHDVDVPVDGEENLEEGIEYDVDKTRVDTSI